VREESRRPAHSTAAQAWTLDGTLRSDVPITAKALGFQARHIWGSRAGASQREASALLECELLARPLCLDMAAVSNSYSIFCHSFLRFLGLGQSDLQNTIF
jgi:hypothetical protein